MARVVLVLLLALLSLSAARAAVLTASFEQIGRSGWGVDLELTNDGDPAEITGFTVYFSEALFADLTVAASPAAWDSIAIQPDLALASPGYFDSLLIDPTSPLTIGQTQIGFRVEFNFVGPGGPPLLNFDIVDQGFNVLFSGTTMAPIPEPAAGALTLIGLGVVLMACRRRLLPKMRLVEHPKAPSART